MAHEIGAPLSSYSGVLTSLSNSPRSIRQLHTLHDFAFAGRPSLREAPPTINLREWFRNGSFPPAEPNVFGGHVLSSQTECSTLDLFEALGNRPSIFIIAEPNDLTPHLSPNICSSRSACQSD